MGPMLVRRGWGQKCMTREAGASAKLFKSSNQLCLSDQRHIAELAKALDKNDDSVDEIVARFNKSSKHTEMR